jgi:hypothetical protein
VTLGNKEENGKVISVDLDGFIEVQVENKEIISFDTDNNSFDLIRGLISTKR